MLDGVFPLTPEGLVPVYDQTLHLTDLVEDLRTLTLAESGRLPLIPEPTDLGELAHAVVEGLRPTAAEDGVTIEVRAEPGLRARVDPRRIRQVLGNLLDNALRYSPPGGTITVTVARVGPEAHVSVRDQGPGSPRGPPPHLRAVLPGGQVPLRGGDGPGARHRPGARPRSRGPDLGRERPRGGVHVLVAPP